MEIDKKIISVTRNCPENFDCLNSDRHVYCKVENCINQNVLFVKYTGKSFCNYKMSFGNSSICTCPTRKEIFNKYKL